MRRLLLAICLGAIAQGQPNPFMSGKMLKAGSRDTVISIDLNPKALEGVWLIMMLPVDGAKLELELPDGRRMNQANALSFDAEWGVGGQGDGMAALAPGMYAEVNHNVFLTAAAPRGKYKIHADARALKQDTALGVMVMPGFGVQFVQISAEPRTREVHYSGEIVEMVVSVKDHDRVIANPTILGRVAHATRDGMSNADAWVPLTLRPVGDGTFLTDLPWTEAGSYRFAFDATGKRIDGRDFTAVESLTVGIEQRLVKLLAVTDRPVDELGKGQVDRIDADVRADVIIPGHYIFVVKLNSQGKDVGYASKVIDLKAGEASVTASFPYQQLEHIEADGPYAVTVEVHQADDQLIRPSPILGLPLAGTSRPYDHKNFGRGRVYFTGAAQATPKSPAGDAPFDQLAVTFDVVTEGGPCEWSTSLGIMAGNSEIATSVQGEHGRLPVGPAKITLLFEGIEIEQKFAGNAAHTRFSGITCGTEHATLHRPFVLPVYPAGTFAIGPATFDLFTEHSEIHLTRDSIATVNLAFHARGEFEAPLHFSLDGLPAGVTIVKSFPDQPVKKIGGTLFFLQSDASAAPGTYTLTGRGRYQNTEHQLTYTLVVEP